MDLFTHLVVGALMYLLFMRDVTLDFLVIAIFFSVLPDLDVFLMPLKRIFKSNYFDHRGGSHSYIIGIIVASIFGGFFFILRQRPFLIVWIIGSLFYALHVSMDLLTTTRIPYLFPISRKERSFHVEKAGSFFTMVNSLIFLITSMLIYSISADIIALRSFIDFYTIFFLIYYFYRISSKLWFSSKLNKNQVYFPGVLPFFFVIFEKELVENTLSLSIVRKSYFSKNKEIFSSKTILTDEEMVFFEQGMALCNTYYYFAKWTAVPIFIRKEGVFSIRFFFIETMMRKRTMFIQYDFDILTRQMISFNRSSGHKKMSNSLNNV
ncbi:MAG: metal-dependent hydrolase [Promethearchaeota archaeon]|nr:MAG: metal-dependent hydrolase [Candidatus Lokiarchaeota archaeon]